jgi:P-type Ca2+ transporter type 2C
VSESICVRLQVTFNLVLLFAVPVGIPLKDCVADGWMIESGPCNSLAPDGTGNNQEANYRTTIIYNSFVWAQIFNEISSRKIYNEINCFEGVLTNGMFIGVIVVSAILQFLTVQILPPYIFNAVPISGLHWLLCLVLGFVSIPLSMVSRLLPPFDIFYKLFPTDGKPETQKVEPEVTEETISA